MLKVTEGKCMEKKRKKQSEKSYPAALTVAGSDSGGGAGIQADLRTFNAFGIFGCSAITAVTSQNPHRVDRVDLLPAAAVASQIDTVMAAIDITSIKSGMLGSAENVEALASAVKKYKFSLVCDPVMVSTSGRKLLEEEAIHAVKEQLLPLASLITPNIPEAGMLLNRKIENFDDQLRAARELYDLFGASVLLKGGHASSAAKPGKLARMCDVVCRNGELWKLSSLKADLPALTAHGTGCTLSAALAASFALDIPWKEAVCVSKAFVLGSLIENVRIGKDVYAMYPPGNDYMNSVQIEAVDLK